MLWQAHIDLGDVWAHQGRYSEALAEYRAAYDLKPDSAEVLVDLGSTLRMLNRDAEAIKCLEQALGLEPGNAPAHHHLALILRKAGREKDALEHLQRHREFTRRLPGDLAELLFGGTF